MRKRTSIGLQARWRCFLACVLALALAASAVHPEAADADELKASVSVAAVSDDGTPPGSLVQISLMQSLIVAFDAGEHGALGQGTTTPLVLDDRAGHNQVSAPPAPQPNEGYTFDGWYDGETKVSFPYTATKDTTLVARYKQAFGVVFDPNGGYHMGVLAEAAGDDVTAPVVVDVQEGAILGPNQYATPERDGYVFDYWSTEPDHSASAFKPFDLSKPIEGYVKLYARWSARYYSISYDESCYNTNGELTGSGSSKLTEYRYSESDEATVVFTPTREGYTFTGWKVKMGDASVDAQDASRVTIPAKTMGNVELEAQWDSVMGALDTPDEATGSVSGPGAGGTAVDIRLMRDGRSNANTALVVFYPRNGEEPTYRTVKKGQVVGSTPVPSDAFEGDAAGVFEFSGWSEDPDVLTPDTTITATTVVEYNIDAFAHWGFVEETVRLEIPSYRGAEPLTATARNGVVTAFPDLSAVNGSEELMYGYEVDSWYTDSGYIFKWDADKRPAPEGGVLYAKCTKTVTVHAGEEGTVTVKELSEGASDNYAWTSIGGGDYQRTCVWEPMALALPCNDINSLYEQRVERPGWKFMRWHTNKDLTQPVCEDTSGAYRVIVGQERVATEYWAEWDAVVTIEFYKYGDVQGAYDNTIEYGSSTTQNIVLPTFEELRISGSTSEVGIPGHRLFKWAFDASEGSGAALGANEKSDKGDGTEEGLFDPGEEVFLGDGDGLSEPMTIRMYAAWQAIIGAELDVLESDFRAPTWLESVPARQIEALEPITLSSSTPRSLSLSAQSITTADERASFRSSFKALPDGEAPDALLQGTTIAFLPNERDTFTYMGENGAPGSIAVVGSISSNGSTTGTLQLRLAEGLRTLRETEVRDLPTEDSGSDTQKAGIGTVKWTVGFAQSNGGNAFVFGSEANPSFD